MLEGLKSISWKQANKEVEAPMKALFDRVRALPELNRAIEACFKNMGNCVKRLSKECSLDGEPLDEGLLYDIFGDAIMYQTMPRFNPYKQKDFNFSGILYSKMKFIFLDELKKHTKDKESLEQIKELEALVPDYDELDNLPEQGSLEL